MVVPIRLEDTPTCSTPPQQRTATPPRESSAYYSPPSAKHVRDSILRSSLKAGYLPLNSVPNGSAVAVDLDSSTEYASSADFASLQDLHTIDDDQKCFGTRSDVERVLDERCWCLRYRFVPYMTFPLIIIIIAAILVIYVMRSHLKDVVRWLHHQNSWAGAFVFVVLFTLVSFPMTWGYIVLNLACGYLYGFFVGLVVVIGSVMIGVATSICVCRRLIKDFVQSRLQSEHLKAIVRVVESRRGFKVVMLTRLTPIPFGLQNGLFALTNMSLYKCLLASTFGLLPTQIINSYMGSYLRTMEDVLRHRSINDYIILAAQLGVSVFLMWYLLRRARIELNKACLPTEHAYGAQFTRNEHSAFGRMPASASTFGLDTIGAREEETERHVDGDVIDLVPCQPARNNGDTEGASSPSMGHKRAHSASAILYALKQSPD